MVGADKTTELWRPPNKSVFSLKFDLDLGQSVGLSVRLTSESDNEDVDLASFVDRSRQNKVMTLLNVVGLLPTSLRLLSVKVIFDPNASDSKELSASVSLGKFKNFLLQLTVTVHYG